jgi:hypothetical protein
MENYKNLSGTSGVAAFEQGVDFIKVQFSDGAVYQYTHASAGEGSVTQMKALAVRGLGLNSFINTTVKYRYAAKLR